MPRVINYIEVSRKIRRYYVSHVNSVTYTSFAKDMKPYLNRSESERLLDHYINIEQSVVPLTAHKFRFNVRQEHFNEDSVRDIFLKYDIQSTFGKKGNNLQVAIVEPVKEEKPIQKFDCSHFSDELLDVALASIQEEKNRRELIQRKKEQLATILAAASISREELQELLAL